ncbi:ATP-binding cassette domain-containing protein, partial [Bifidobacterium cuniculi]
GGQQQRVAIAGMLAMDAQVLILDEPTAMLDPQGRAEVMRTLDAVQAHGTAIVLVTHHPEERLKADRVLTLDHGRIVSDRPPIPLEDGSRPVAADRPDGLSEASRTDTAAEPMVRFEQVTFAYHRQDAPVLEDWSCEVRQGETVAVTGANGSGKTTFARLLAGLERPVSGRVLVDGIDVGHAGRRDRKALRRTVGLIMQRPERQLFADTVAQDVAFGPINQGLSPDAVADRVREALALVGMEDHADRSPFALSGGQQRLVAIAGVLACHPRLLVMDEPTASLDEKGTGRVLRIMRELRERGVTVVVITHDLGLAREMADRTFTFTPAGTERAQSTVSAADPMHSPVARLDPRAKMGGVLVFMFSMFAMTSWPQLAVGAVVTAALVAASRVGPSRLWHAVRAFVALFACTALLNLAVVHEGRVLCTIWHWQVTDGAVGTALLYWLRFSLVIICGAVVLLTTTPTAITNGFESLMTPLKRWWHVQEIALVLSLALRFVPTLAGEAMGIRDAQAARGGAIESGSPMRRMRAFCAIIVPVFAGTIRHARGLALALDARSYQEGMPRSHWHPLHMRASDWAFLAAVAASVGAVAVLHMFNM